MIENKAGKLKAGAPPEYFAERKESLPRRFGLAQVSSWAQKIRRSAPGIFGVCAVALGLHGMSALAATLPFGVQQNVPISTVTGAWGWKIVYQGTYGTFDVPIGTVFSGVSPSDYVMYAAAPVGSSVFTVLAAAPASDVRKQTAWNATTTSNGVAWYYNGYSIGFAPAGASIQQGSADVANQSDPLRLSWHSGIGQPGYSQDVNQAPLDIDGGWRAGTVTGLNFDNTWNRYVLVAKTRPANPVYSIVTAKNNLLPEATGTKGPKYLSFGIPSINDSAKFAFVANISGTNGTGSSPAILTGTSPSVLIRKGDVAPGTSGTFVSFKDPLLNADGEIAVIAKIGAVDVTGSNDYGLWTTLGGSLQLVNREGDVQTSPSGAVLKTIKSVALSSSKVAYVADMVTGTSGSAGPGGVTSSNDLGLWISNGAGPGTLVLREGDPLVLSTGTLTVTSFVALSNGNIGRGQGHGIEGDQILVRVSGPGKQAVLAVTTAGLSEVCSTGSGVPGYGVGATFTSFGYPTQNTAGEATFLGVAKTGTGGVTSSTNLGLYIEHSGTLAQVVHKGIAAPLTSGSFLSFKDPVSNGSGKVAFLTTLSGPGITGTTDTAVYLSGTAGLRLIAVEGGDAPETTGTDGSSAKFKSFTSLALAEDDPLILATLVTGANGTPGPGGVTTANDMGLWATDVVGNLRLILREGQQIGTQTVRSFSVLGVVPGSPQQTRSFNANAQLTVKVAFTDGTQAIVRIDRP